MNFILQHALTIYLVSLTVLAIGCTTAMCYELKNDAEDLRSNPGTFMLRVDVWYVIKRLFAIFVPVVNTAVLIAAVVGLALYASIAAREWLDESSFLERPIIRFSWARRMMGLSED